MTERFIPPLFIKGIQSNFCLSLSRWDSVSSKSIQLFNQANHIFLKEPGGTPTLILKCCPCRTVYSIPEYNPDMASIFQGNKEHHGSIFSLWYCSIVYNIEKGTSLVAQTIKRLSTMRETRVQSQGWEDPLEKEMAIHSRTIAWEITCTEEPARLQSTGSQRVRHN